ncbi:hypothetical protein CPB83DRAFT_429994 [Crepidotus variabilis]|uniref:Uncharacterized protein n=1 Tax=Crepidotus variabilis TaxID=179855 RepID=A0A9P6EDR3_9AGAR|nr:hypothetical protein CPB83DRAFT_429994 [Crepidotus variabilis]
MSYAQKKKILSYTNVIPEVTKAQQVGLVEADMHSDAFTALHACMEVDTAGLTRLAVSKALSTIEEVEEELSPFDDPFSFYNSEGANLAPCKGLGVDTRITASEASSTFDEAEKELSPSNNLRDIFSSEGASLTSCINVGAEPTVHASEEGGATKRGPGVFIVEKPHRKRNVRAEDEHLQPLCVKKLRTEPKEKAATAAAARRRVRRQNQADSFRSIRTELWNKYGSKSDALETDLESEKLPSNSTGYGGKSVKGSEDMGDLFPFVRPSKGPSTARDDVVEQPKEDSQQPDPQPSKELSALGGITDQKVCRTLEKLMSEKDFAYKAWDGSVSHPVLDSLKRVVVVLVGMPHGESYKASIRNAFKLMEKLGGSASFSDKETSHLRGHFPAINAGISLGPGGKIPTRVLVGSHEEMVQCLLDNKDVQRLASHQDASFKFWQPKLYAHYDNMMAKLKGRMPNLRKNFTRSIFASTAFNFPPNVRTFRHRDVRNLPYGMCAIHALGDFEHKSGGHLILWDLKLIIEFPPGAMVIIPSATVNHSNVPVALGQKRASITQYTAGSLFRYVDNDFETDIDFQARDAEGFATHSALRRSHWERGVNKWSKYVDGELI